MTTVSSLVQFIRLPCCLHLKNLICLRAGCHFLLAQVLLLLALLVTAFINIRHGKLWQIIDE